METYRTANTPCLSLSPRSLLQAHELIRALRTSCLRLVHGIEVILVANAPSIQVWFRRRDFAVLLVPVESHLELEIQEVLGMVVSPVYHNVGSSQTFFGGVIAVVLLYRSL